MRRLRQFHSRKDQNSGLFLVLVQLALLTAVLHQFQIESAGFFRLAILLRRVCNSRTPSAAFSTGVLSALSVLGIALILES
jgi:hypothetical protein